MSQGVIKRYKILDYCNLETIQQICTELSISEKDFMRLAQSHIHAPFDFTPTQLELIAAILDTNLIDLFSNEYMEWKLNNWFTRL